eukprot:gene430-2432_t
MARSTLTVPSHGNNTYFGGSAAHATCIFLKQREDPLARAMAVKCALREGKPLVGHMIWEFATRGIARCIEGAGVDFVVIDMEHSSFSVDTLADLLSWFRYTKVATFVRIPSIEYHFIARVLDAGATGIMAPNVQSMEEVDLLVRSMKYTPVGRRGLGLTQALNDYAAPTNCKEYLQNANDSTVLIIQIESQAALDIIDDIAAHPEVDVLWVGHFDLTADMGICGEFDDPRFSAALDKVVDAGKRHGKSCAIQMGTMQATADMKNR